MMSENTVAQSSSKPTESASSSPPSMSSKSATNHEGAENRKSTSCSSNSKPEASSKSKNLVINQCEQNKNNSASSDSNASDRKAPKVAKKADGTKIVTPSKKPQKTDKSAAGGNFREGSRSASNSVIPSGDGRANNEGRANNKTSLSQDRNGNSTPSIQRKPTPSSDSSEVNGRKASTPQPFRKKDKRSLTDSGNKSGPRALTPNIGHPVEGGSGEKKSRGDNGESTDHRDISKSASDKSLHRSSNRSNSHSDTSVGSLKTMIVFNSERKPSEDSLKKADIYSDSVKPAVSGSKETSSSTAVQYRYTRDELMELLSNPLSHRMPVFICGDGDLVESISAAAAERRIIARAGEDESLRDLEEGGGEGMKPRMKRAPRELYQVPRDASDDVRGSRQSDDDGDSKIVLGPQRMSFTSGCQVQAGAMRRSNNDRGVNQSGRIGSGRLILDKNNQEINGKEFSQRGAGEGRDRRDFIADRRGDRDFVGDRRGERDFTGDLRDKRSDRDFTGDLRDKRSDRDFTGDLRDKRSDREFAGDLRDKRIDRDFAGDKRSDYAGDGRERRGERDFNRTDFRGERRDRDQWDKDGRSERDFRNIRDRREGARDYKSELSREYSREYETRGLERRRNLDNEPWERGGGPDQRYGGDRRYGRRGEGDNEGGRYYNRNQSEPEWFSGGPTDQSDTIELIGFEDDRSSIRSSIHTESEHSPRNRKESVAEDTEEYESKKSADVNDPLEETSETLRRSTSNSNEAEGRPGEFSERQPDNSAIDSLPSETSSDLDFNKLLDFWPTQIPAFEERGESRFQHLFSNRGENYNNDQLTENIPAEMRRLRGPALPSSPPIYGHSISMNPEHEKKNFIELLHNAHLLPTTAAPDQLQNSAGMPVSADSLKSVEMNLKAMLLSGPQQSGDPYKRTNSLTRAQSPKVPSGVTLLTAEELEASLLVSSRAPAGPAVVNRSESFGAEEMSLVMSLSNKPNEQLQQTLPVKPHLPAGATLVSELERKPASDGGKSCGVSAENKSAANDLTAFNKLLDLMGQHSVSGSNTPKNQPVQTYSGAADPVPPTVDMSQNVPDPRNQPTSSQMSYQQQAAMAAARSSPTAVAAEAALSASPGAMRPMIHSYQPPPDPAIPQAYNINPSPIMFCSQPPMNLTAPQPVLAGFHAPSQALSSHMTALNQSAQPGHASAVTKQAPLVSGLRSSGGAEVSGKMSPACFTPTSVLRKLAANRSVAGDFTSGSQVGSASLSSAEETADQMKPAAARGEDSAAVAANEAVVQQLQQRIRMLYEAKQQQLMQQLNQGGLSTQLQVELNRQLQAAMATACNQQQLVDQLRGCSNAHQYQLVLKQLEHSQLLPQQQQQHQPQISQQALQQMRLFPPPSLIPQASNNNNTAAAVAAMTPAQQQQLIAQLQQQQKLQQLRLQIAQLQQQPAHVHNIHLQQQLQIQLLQQQQSGGSGTALQGGSGAALIENNAALRQQPGIPVSSAVAGRPIVKGGQQQQLQQQYATNSSATPINHPLTNNVMAGGTMLEEAGGGQIDIGGGGAGDGSHISRWFGNMGNVLSSGGNVPGHKFKTLDEIEGGRQLDK